MRLYLKIIILIFIFTAAVITLVGLTTFSFTKYSLEERTYEQLENIIELKEIQINEFIKDGIFYIENLTKNEFLIDNLIGIYRSESNESEGLSFYENIGNFLNEQLISYKNNFIEIFITDLNGKILFSTNPLQEGKIKSDEPYFVEGIKKMFVQSFYYDASIQKSVIMISGPLKDNDGNLIGVVGGMVNPDEITKMMMFSSGLGKTGEVYLVDKFNFLVTKSKFLEETEYKKTIHTKGVEDCLNKRSGRKLYNNYIDVPVIGVYKWIPEREVCIIAEINQKEAFKTIIDLIKFNILSSFILLLTFLFIGFFFTRKLIKPIFNLIDAAKKIEKGDLNTEIKIETRDELGDLSLAFKNMLQSLRESREKIEGYSKELEKNVKERTEELNKKIKDLTEMKNALLNITEDLNETNEELVKAQNELKKSFKELKKLDLEKDKFISIAAHELKTPMTAIYGFAQLLEDEKIIMDVEKRNKFLKIIKEEIKRLNKLVSNILDLSRADLGTMKFTIEEVDIFQFMKNIETEMSQKAKDKGLKLNFEIDRNLPKIKTDKEKLREIMINLIDNSIKYTEKGGIRVEIHRKDNYIQFSVSDTGIGIPKEAFNKIFTRFFQVESPYTRKVSGSGLGLSICKELVKALNGKIWFESKVGEGTTFYFTLPIKPKSFRKYEDST